MINLSLFREQVVDNNRSFRPAGNAFWLKLIRIASMYKIQGYSLFYVRGGPGRNLGLVSESNRRAHVWLAMHLFICPHQHGNHFFACNLGVCSKSGAALSLHNSGLDSCAYSISVPGAGFHIREACFARSGQTEGSHQHGRKFSTGNTPVWFKAGSAVTLQNLLVHQVLNGRSGPET